MDEREAEVEHVDARHDAILSWEQASYPRALDYDQANILRRLLAAWASPFLVRGKKVWPSQHIAQLMLSPHS